jgi:hypothetical protein
MGTTWWVQVVWGELTGLSQIRGRFLPLVVYAVQIALQGDPMVLYGCIGTMGGSKSALILCYLYVVL